MPHKRASPFTGLGNAEIMASPLSAPVWPLIPIQRSEGGGGRGWRWNPSNISAPTCFHKEESSTAFYTLYLRSKGTLLTDTLRWKQLVLENIHPFDKQLTVKYSSIHQILKRQFSERPSRATSLKTKPPHFLALLCFSAHTLIIIIHIQMRIYKFIYKFNLFNVFIILSMSQKCKLSPDKNL